MKALISSIKNNSKTYLWSAVLVLLNFGIDYSLEYATDTYSTFNEKGTWYHVIYENGRPLKALIYYIFEFFNTPGALIYHLSQALAIVLIALSVALFAILLKPYINKEYLRILISFVTLVNPFFIEFMLFEEKSLFMLVILLNIFAFALTERNWRESDGRIPIKDILLIQLCLWVSVFIYQTIINEYVILCLPLVAIYSRNIKDFLRKNIFLMVMYGIPMGCAFILAKFFLPVERLDNNLDLAGKLENFLNIFYFVTMDNFYTLRKGLFLIWLLILLAAALLVIAGSKGKRLLTTFYMLYISLGCMIVSFLLYITGSSTVCWPRMVYSYGMLFGLVSFYILYLGKELSMPISLSSLARKIVIALMCIILVMDYISFGKAFLERHRANQEDLYYAEIIGQRIAEYEEETGITIDTLCYYKDHHIAVFARGFEKSRLSERAQASGWSRHNSIEIYLDRTFTQGQPDPQLQEMFSQKDWNMYSEDQLIFDGSTLHICVY